jgi:hypothetical protein
LARTVPPLMQYARSSRPLDTTVSTGSSYASMNQPKGRNERVDQATETKVLALIARGDTYDAIKGVLESEGTIISIATISAIKSRNKSALDFMKQELVKHEVSASTKLLGKARQLLERKLTRALNAEQIQKELIEEAKSGELEPHIFEALYNKALKAELTVAELTSLSKEMFNQSQVEQGKPTSITESPAQAKENLKTLLEAINNQDDEKILKAIFPDAQRTPVA